MTSYAFIAFINRAPPLRAIPAARNPIPAGDTGVKAVGAKKSFNIFFDEEDNSPTPLQDKMDRKGDLLPQQTPKKKQGRPPKSIDPQLIAALIAHGLGYKAISQQLGVSVKTIQRTLKRNLSKKCEAIDYNLDEIIKTFD